MPAGNKIKKPCLFCDIVSKSVEARVVFEDKISLAFLDHRPLFAGHTLLVPKKHYATLLDLPDDLAGAFFGNVRRLASAVERGLAAQGSFLAMNNHVSQSVPHLHVHIVPRKFKDGLKGFFWPRQRVSEEQMEEARVKVISALGEQNGPPG